MLWICCCLVSTAVLLLILGAASDRGRLGAGLATVATTSALALVTAGLHLIGALRWLKEALGFSRHPDAARLRSGFQDEQGGGRMQASSCRQLSSLCAEVLTASEDEMGWLVHQLAKIHSVDLSATVYMASRETSARIAESLTKLRAVVASSYPGIPALHEPLDDPLLGRLLVASDFKVSRSMELVNSYVKYRYEQSGAVAPVPAVMRTGFCHLDLMDTRGRPVLLLRGKFLDLSIPLCQMQQHFHALQDAILLHFLRRRSGFSKENPLEQYVCVIDCEGISRANVSLKALQMLVQETTTRYPDKVQEIILLGVNSTVHSIWRLARPCLHPRTRKKLRLVSKEEVASTMRALVVVQALPANYGGEAPRMPDPREVDTLGLPAMVGSIAASAWEEVEDKLLLKRESKEVKMKPTNLPQVLCMGMLASLLCSRKPSKQKQSVVSRIHAGLAWAGF